MAKAINPEGMTEEEREIYEKKKKSKKKTHKLDRNPHYTWGKRKLDTDEAVVKRINALHTALWELEPVDLDDVEEVEERTETFFRLCDEYQVKALWETYAYALGYSIQMLMYVMNGVHKKRSKHIITKAHWRLKSDLAQLAASGQVNPVTAIFQQKNNYGYVDKVEITATSADPLGDTGNLLEIKQRLIESVPKEDVVADVDFVEVKDPENAVPEK